jgi:hypothetical protein
MEILPFAGRRKLGPAGKILAGSQEGMEFFGSTKPPIPKWGEAPSEEAAEMAAKAFKTTSE